MIGIKIIGAGHYSSFWYFNNSFYYLISYDNSFYLAGSEFNATNNILLSSIYFYKHYYPATVYLK